MIRASILRFAIVGVIVIGAAAVVFPTHQTQSAFTDSRTGLAEFEMAGGPGGGGNLPNNAVAYHDIDGDLEYDDGEPTYKQQDLRSFDNTSVDLVIPDRGDTISPSGQHGISIRAGSITSRAEMTTSGSDIDLVATQGGVDIDSASISLDGYGALTITAARGMSAADASIGTMNGDLTVEAQSAANLDGASFTTHEGYTPLTITATSISGTDAEFETASGAISLAATAGSIDVDDASLTISQNDENIDLTATRDVSAAAAMASTQDGDVVIQADGVTTLDDATVEISGDNGASRITSGEISADGASVSTVRSDVDWSTTSGALTLGNADVTVTDQNGNVDLTSAGDLAAAGSTLRTNNGEISLDSGGQATLTHSRVDIEEGSPSMTLSAGSIVADNVHVTTAHGGIDWTASTTDFAADGANFTVRDQNGGVKLQAAQHATLTDAVLDVRDGTQSVNVTAGSIEAEGLAAFTVEGDVELFATDGIVEMNGGNVTVREENGGIYIEAAGEAVLDGSEVDVKGGYDPVTVSAESVSAWNTSILTGSEAIVITATDGEIDLREGNLTVRSGNAGIEIDAPGQADLSNAVLKTEAESIAITSEQTVSLDGSAIDIVTSYSNVTVTGQTVTANDSRIDTASGSIELNAITDGGGSLWAVDASLDVDQDNGEIVVESRGNVHLNASVLRTANGDSMVDLGDSSSTLFVDGTTIEGGNGNLMYSPSGGTVRPDREDVVAGS